MGFFFKFYLRILHFLVYCVKTLGTSIKNYNYELFILKKNTEEVGKMSERGVKR